MGLVSVWLFEWVCVMVWVVVLWFMLCFWIMLCIIIKGIDSRSIRKLMISVLFSRGYLFNLDFVVGEWSYF